jgi:hypothetical protein
VPVDEQAEARLREAFSGAIGRRPEKVSAALAGVPQKQAETVVGLALFVIGFVVNDACGDGASDGTVRDLAQKIIDGESDWSNVGDLDLVTRFLAAAARGDVAAVNQLAAEDVVGLSVVAGAHLLAHFRLPDQRWYQYLDEILDGYEASDTN